MMNALISVELSSPPRITMAIGLWISLPGLSPPRARGIRASAAVRAVIKIAFSLSADPEIIRSRRVLPSCLRLIYLEIRSMPFLVAIPKSVMNPIIEGILTTLDESLMAIIPPIRASAST